MRPTAEWTIRMLFSKRSTRTVLDSIPSQLPDLILRAELNLMHVIIVSCEILPQIKI